MIHRVRARLFLGSPPTSTDRPNALGKRCGSGRLPGRTPSPSFGPAPEPSGAATLHSRRVGKVMFLVYEIWTA